MAENLVLITGLSINVKLISNNKGKVKIIKLI
jgi:hypothetical protein